MSFMNRLGNCTNPYQTDAKKVLCLCSAGLLRSPTTANVLHAEYGYNTRAAGVTDEFALIPVDAVLVSWADEIVCVEQSVYDVLWDKFHDVIKKHDKKVVVLDVPDKYEWNAQGLQTSILSQYETHLASLKKE